MNISKCLSVLYILLVCVVVSASGCGRKSDELVKSEVVDRVGLVNEVEAKNVEVVEERSLNVDEERTIELGDQVQLEEWKKLVGQLDESLSDFSELQDGIKF